MSPTEGEFDRRMMGRCVDLAHAATDFGEYPYAAVVVIDGKPVAEAVNHAFRDKDLSRHAEIVALAEAGRTAGLERLRGATLYSLVEPCAMCAYCIREAGIGRVVYALQSPVMGGNSHWNILRDDTIADRIPLIFAPAPEVVTGVMAAEARQVWQRWSPIAARIVESSRILVTPRAEEDKIRTAGAQRRRFLYFFKVLLQKIRGWRKGG